MGDGPTLRRNMRGIGVRMARRGLPLLAIVGPARRYLRGSRPWDDDISLRWALKDFVEMGHHPLRVVAASVALVPSSSLGESSSGSPLCLDFARRVSSACRSRFFFFSFFFSKSFADFCFSADSRLLSRSTSSSFTGGFEDQASIDPCTGKDKS